MDRNNGRFPYMRRQGSGNGPHNHHHHNNNANSSSSSTTATTSSTSSSTSSGSAAATNTQYSNNSINNAPTNSNVIYAAASQQQQQQQQQGVTISQHDELIRYIREAWNKVREQDTEVIDCNESDNQLKNFKPFDLEQYWGQRLVQNIHVTTTHQ
ncbi:protein kinase 4 [Drosophila grimshawi]|uniref:GH10648 n=1 Tax=Drosophila grimshawi TaxID=7222 RepID=B4JCK0_DROGR|nr:protein kinase 4 [Drosophila grimshawi]EDW03154.1 GH10648 [Drosophila grimshawi]